MRSRFLFRISFYWREISPGETRFYPGTAVYSTRDGWRRTVIRHPIRAFYGLGIGDAYSIGVTIYGRRSELLEPEHRGPTA